jgi:hypothetical protein
MKNLDDLKEDLFQNLEDLLTGLSGTDKQAVASEIIHDAAYWGSQSRIESIGLLEAAKLDMHESFKKGWDLKQYSKN